MQEEFAELLHYAQHLLAKGKRKLEQLDLEDRAAVLAWQRSRRAQFRRLLDVDRLPAGETSQASCCGEVAAGGGVVIEKWLLEPLPGYGIPLLVYRPAQPDASAAALSCETVTGPCGAAQSGETVAGLFRAVQSGETQVILSQVGHYEAGKAAESYQLLNTQLAALGYTVACFDPIGQGERQFPAPKQLETATPEELGDWYNSVNQHSRLGVLASLVGVNLSAFFMYDALCVVDFLQERFAEAVNRGGILALGHSGGATATAYLTAIDERIVRSIPIHYMTTFEQLLRHNPAAPGDHEQSLHGFLHHGFDMADYYRMAAPRAVAINAGTADFFPIAGTRIVVEQLRAFYAHWGQAEAVQLVELPVDHRLDKAVREETVRLVHGEFVEEPSTLEALTPEKLACTNNGRVYAELHTAAPLRLLRELRDAERGKRLEAGGGQEGPEGQEGQEGQAWQGVPPDQDCNALRSWLGRALRLTEEKVFVPASRPDAAFGGSNYLQVRLHGALQGATRLLVLCEQGAGMADEELYPLAAASQTAVLRIPLWGGQLTPDGKPPEQYPRYDEELRLSLYASVCGEQTIGIRVRQIRAGIQNVCALPLPIVLAGAGSGATAALLAALFLPDVTRVVAVGGTTAFDPLLETVAAPSRPSELVFGLLANMDIKDVERALAPATVVQRLPLEALHGSRSALWKEMLEA